MKDKWIRTSSAIPSNGLTVLAYWEETQHFNIVEYDDDGDWIEANGSSSCVHTPSHWQPLERPAT